VKIAEKLLQKIRETVSQIFKISVKPIQTVFCATLPLKEVPEIWEGNLVLTLGKKILTDTVSVN
jgi:hypothetical protein